MKTKKHYPEEWTNAKGEKMLTCICGNSLPCKYERKPNCYKVDYKMDCGLRSLEINSYNIEGAFYSSQEMILIDCKFEEFEIISITLV